MVIVDFIMKLIGRPPIFEKNSYPDMAGITLEEATQRHIARRIHNGGGFYFPAPPPPPIPQTPTEKPTPPMVEFIKKVGVLKNSEIELELIQNSDFYIVIYRDE